MGDPFSHLRLTQPGCYNNGLSQVYGLETTCNYGSKDLSHLPRHLVRYGSKMTFDNLFRWHHYFVYEIVPLTIKPVIVALRPLFRFIREPFHHKDKLKYFNHHILPKLTWQ